MHKSAQLRDYTQQWLERKRDYVPNAVKSLSQTPAQQNSYQTLRATASSSSAVAVTRTPHNSSTSKHRSGARQRRLPPVYVKLAEENTPSDEIDSDSSTYDHRNVEETDSCKDESDYSNDGYVTDGIAVMDVYEFEVDDSSESEDLFSCSSSGTEDMVDSEMIQNMLSMVSESESDLGFYCAQDADTEDSDASTDPEIGRADYWTCIKCKNQQNNPMYRFCEKCYQIRKDHFPPRPKHRKRKRGCPPSRGNSKLFGSPSTSISSRLEKNDEDGRTSRCSSDGSDDIGNEFIQKSKQTRKQRRRTTSHKQNHSAGESSCCSSQELSPDEQQSTLPSNYLVAACASSQETYCTELEHIVNVNNKSNSNLFEHNYPNSQESVFPNSEPASQTSLLENVFESARSLSKLDSLASTVSGFSVGSSQSSSEHSSVTVPEVKSSDSFGDRMTDPKYTEERDTDDLMSKTPTSKKRKHESCDEINDSDVDDDELTAKKFRVMEESDSSNGMCMVCLTEPKNGAFVHNRFLHVCCCYRCAVKVWNKRKRCPICNLQVKNVLKMFVH